MGTTKITRRDICIGSDTNENALLFVENLVKVSKAKEESNPLNELMLENRKSVNGSVTTGDTLID